jgi:hypothetical protein
MTVFTEAQARERLDVLLEQAIAQGQVRIRREDGREFLLTPALAIPPVDGVDTDRPRRDLSDLAGTWVEDPGFDQALAGQDQVDPELWK